jgi:hypothetical protein
MQEKLEINLSPLLEAEPQSLDELFNAVIATMSDEDFVRLVAFFRAEAERFGEMEARGEKAKKISVPKAAIAATESLEDLL